MLNINNIKIPLEHSKKDLEKKIISKLRIKKTDLINYKIKKKSIDSRDKSNVYYVYNFIVEVKNENKYLKIKGVQKHEDYYFKVDKINNFNGISPIIVGCGPAGLLSGIILAEAGLRPIIIEQGKDVEQREKDIKEFWETGQLLDTSNVQFGAGGAGTFSDGKLTTGVNNKRKWKLIEELILAGAPEEIRYLSKPHLGTDILVKVVGNMCKKIESLGGKIFYETKFLTFNKKDDKLVSIVVENKKNKRQIDCQHLILALGHSARDTFYELFDLGLEMKAKAFAVGVRIEHLQKDVNLCQYGKAANKLDSASYKLNVKLKTGRTLHTFCMCPGGVVVGASSEEGKVVTNGMSYYKRDLINSNSALLVNVLPEDFLGEENPLNGIKFQRKLEMRAYEVGGGNYCAPVQKVGDFLKGEISLEFNKIKPTYKPGVKSANLEDVLPQFISDTLKEGIIKLQDKVEFLKDKEAVLTAIESRSSSPVTIVRNEELMCNVYGVFPCGEGAGYAGGIVSAAIDGIRCAEKVINIIESCE